MKPAELQVAGNPCGWLPRCIPAIMASLVLPGAVAGDVPASLSAPFGKYCFDCHSHDLSEGGLNLQAMTADADFGRSFRDWDRVSRVLREQTMPPAGMPHPSASDRQRLAEVINVGVSRFITQHAGDPGPVLMRRLTSAEYAYTIQDLTGLEQDFARGFVSDGVGGEGFTNAGGAQFMQDSTLQRYLEAAKLVASHAVVGSGPLTFYEHPGTTGRELSAISRIQALYRQHGFRTAAGEGAEAFGLDLYPRAMFVAWTFRFRHELKPGDVSLTDLAEQEGLSPRLCEHMHHVVMTDESPFPLSLIVSQWQQLPSPDEATQDSVRRQCQQIADVLRDWQSTLAAAAGDEEEASVLTAGDVHVTSAHSFEADINWNEGSLQTDFELSVSTASDTSAEKAVVIWRNPRLQFRREDGRREPPRPLSAFVTPETAERLQFGRHPGGLTLDEHDFVVTGNVKLPVKLQIPDGRASARLLVDVELDETHDPASIVRCRISDGEVEGETAAEVGESSTLLAVPGSDAVAEWQVGVAKFAALLPEVSQREPAPSDRDPIPAPFDNTYNKPERNLFHSAVKYHRDDQFLVQHIIDDETRQRLDEAWTDLLTSFDYHDVNLRFVNDKYALDLPTTHIGELDAAALEALPTAVRDHVRHYRDEFHFMQQTLRSAESGHVLDALSFAERAWRRPLSELEQDRLTTFYTTLRSEHGSGHEEALRGMLVRILVAPAFLYRVEDSDAEEPGSGDADVVPLNDFQLASRLSYLLWSSMPDAELTTAAAGGQLRSPVELQRQLRRMMTDPRTRRLSAEFFGQWLGFYRFDQFRGVDRQRFPEFTDELQAAMYDEAVTFFDHVVREDRPVDEILFADYAFLNQPLAEFYGIPEYDLPANRFVRTERVDRQHRGGLLGMGAILTATSAPLRTSAVKRGDWVLRRIVGTPVPPPPADAGSIPADDVLADGLTIRQRFEAHRDSPACVNCHSRIDPLGFALEHYDPIGRWRETYRDGNPIDSSGTLADGTEVSGPDGLRSYLQQQRSQFHQTLCSKLLGYSLGRSVLASDRPLIQDMMAELERQGSFRDLIERIVLSEQFRNRRSKTHNETAEVTSRQR